LLVAGFQALMSGRFWALNDTLGQSDGDLDGSVAKGRQGGRDRATSTKIGTAGSGGGAAGNLTEVSSVAYNDAFKPTGASYSYGPGGGRRRKGESTKKRLIRFLRR
jgi:hypothetical protein